VIEVLSVKSKKRRSQLPVAISVMEVYGEGKACSASAFCATENICFGLEVLLNRRVFMLGLQGTLTRSHMDSLSSFIHSCIHALWL
jgi:hypothetical protein